MNRRRLFGIDCALAALALALAAAAPPVRAQLLPLPLPVPVVNLAPVVIAGLDQVITLPGSANLTGVAIDDGQPNPPGVLTTTWSPVSGYLLGERRLRPAADGLGRRARGER